MHSPKRGTVRKLAEGLGWFSIALGITELAAGGPLSRWLGMRRRGALIRSYGAREVVTGAGIIVDGSRGWLWGRVAGDMVDIATLALSLRRGRARTNASVALAAVAGVTALDVFCALMLGRRSRSQTALLTARGTVQGLSALPQRVTAAVRQPIQAQLSRLPQRLTR
ncbi:MAG TPA: hypothetical protein VKX28_26490 [Xanthobacteraceae bacterium]|nr:hypothetical protein [Xanthobacteraceae bacterium]